MTFAFKILFLALIIRISVTTEYRPVLWGVIFGLVSGVEVLAFGYGISAALISTVAAGATCALYLLVLWKLENHGIIWWLVLVLGILAPVIAGALFIGGSTSLINHKSQAAPNLAILSAGYSRLQRTLPATSGLEHATTARGASMASR
jgi:hypothetical protein